MARKTLKFRPKTDLELDPASKIHFATPEPTNRQISTNKTSFPMSDNKKHVVERGTVMYEGLSMRFDPSRNAKVKGSFPKGTKLEFYRLENIFDGLWGQLDDGNWVLIGEKLTDYVKLD